jgi:hypothetical protein
MDAIEQGKLLLGERGGEEETRSVKRDGCFAGSTMRFVPRTNALECSLLNKKSQMATRMSGTLTIGVGKNTTSPCSGVRFNVWRCCYGVRNENDRARLSADT